MIGVMCAGCLLLAIAAISAAVRYYNKRFAFHTFAISKARHRDFVFVDIVVGVVVTAISKCGRQNENN